ncbi:unnamed protein product [Cylindrotheca closterium]|uniref:NAD(P)-binding domain-containing protein n=1 Tax=Cylindrotheca closterium TaxID=2856 RepID=A0AAD2GBZ3_9STRA|nr:unnamed protein product [Cylindrotheca closterium]
MPSNSRGALSFKNAGRESKTSRSAAVQSGDRVLVVGGTGGVGQLTVGKLQGRGGFEVRTTTRNKSKGEEVIADSGVNVFELDLLSEDTTALEAAMEGVAGVVISVGTTAFPTARWKGGNTPKAIDEEAVKRIASVAAKVDTMKKIVMVTSVGVDRTGEMPFLILNLFGVLDAKKSGERAVATAAAQGGFDYAVIRPGRLVGGPFTNLDVAKLLKVEGGAENGVSLARGDSLLGDCKRDACAEAVIQSLINEECKNLEYSIISTEEKALTDPQWIEAFQKL